MSRTEQSIYRYRQLCAVERSIPLFSRDWWLDSVCGEGNWGVCLVDKNSEISAAMPYCLDRKYGFKLIIQPLLTQTMGPWIKPLGGKYSSCVAQQKDLMQELIVQLPANDYFSQNWHYEYTNWLPFFWSDFSQTTRYTYVLEDLSDLDAVYDRFQSNIRGDIRKAQNRFKLTVRDDLGIDELLRLNRLTFRRQNMGVPYPDRLVRTLEQEASKRSCSRLLVAEDPRGHRHAAVLLVWDEQSMYYLIGGADPELRNSGANSLCLWEAIKLASGVTQSFDFEGSMLESVERYFRSFGAKQKAYFNINKTNSRFLRLHQCCKIFFI